MMEGSELLVQARQASFMAYAPYSHFRVGAAVLMDDGVVVRGSNQECASYSLTLCAERVALAAAFSQYPTGRVVKIAIFSPDSAQVSPCGACREYLAECSRRSGYDIEVITQSFTVPVSSLLPHPFLIP